MNPDRHKHSKLVFKCGLVLTLAATLLTSSPVISVVQAATGPAVTAVVSNPQRATKASYGFFVDHYKENTKKNAFPSTNPAIALFNNSFMTYWDKDGRVAHATLMNQNIQKSIRITNQATKAQQDRSYFTDRRDLRYNLISGLGDYAQSFIEKANAQTDFNSVPSAPLPSNAMYSRVPWADEHSALGNVVKLVNLNESAPWSGTHMPKTYIQYQRPYRQDSRVKVNPYLKNVMAAAGKADYDFPSGHTTAAFETGEMLAYVFPQRYQELLTRASEVGYDRVLAGRHSPLAVMGGRILGTAMTAATLNDPANQVLIQTAYDNAQHSLYKTISGDGAGDDFASYQKNLEDYTYRLTYDFAPIGDTTKPMVVPKGAEVLLQTRLPYLTAAQRREVLATTGLPSGYPMTEDAEGWGRLNLFKAANGYGALNQQVTVNMSSGSDVWKNNMTGHGGLVKDGGGQLTLLGQNQYQGDTVLNSGTLTAASDSAFGYGTVMQHGGTLSLATSQVNLAKEYQQDSNATLKIDDGQKLAVRGKAVLNGRLVVRQTPGVHQGTIMTFKESVGHFNNIKLEGFSSGAHVVYTGHSIEIIE